MATPRQSVALRFRIDDLNRRLDVAEGEGERLSGAAIALDVAHVIGHNHAVVAGLLIHEQGPRHVYVEAAFLAQSLKPAEQIDRQ